MTAELALGIFFDGIGFLDEMGTLFYVEHATKILV